VSNRCVTGAAGPEVVEEEVMSDDLATVIDLICVQIILLLPRHKLRSHQACYPRILLERHLFFIVGTEWNFIRMIRIWVDNFGRWRL
jgi:hypothetical protein